MCMSARSGGEEKDDDEYRHRGDDRPDFQQAEETRIGFVRCLHFLLCHRFSPITPSAVRERTAQRPESVLAPVFATHPAMLNCGLASSAVLAPSLPCGQSGLALIALFPLSECY